MRRPAIVLSIVFGLLLPTVVASAAPSPSRTPKCVGTYLMVEDLGAWSLWTLSGDGTAQVTSSAEDSADFSHQQGAWRQLPSGLVNVTTLDFPVDDAQNPTNVARVDAELSFSNGCQDVAGGLELRYYAVPSEDPLDPSAGTFILSEDFTGRRVTAQ
jgi:hypothetical protein